MTADNAADQGVAEDVVASDLFFSLSAMLIVIMCLMSQSLRAAVTDPAPSDAALSRAAVDAGRWLILARADGATLTGPDGSVLRLALSDLLNGQAEQWSRAAGPALTQIIAADATDSAFLLDTVLARAGLAEISRIRLDQPCPGPRIIGNVLACDG